VRMRLSDRQYGGSSFRTAAVLSAIAGVVLAGVVVLVGPRRVNAAPLAGGGRSPCLAVPDDRTEPSWVTIGNSLQVLTTVRFSCPEFARPTQPFHLMIVADRPALSPHGAAGEPMMRELETLAQRVALEQNREAHVGLVAFNHRAETLCRLYERSGSLEECAEGLPLPDGPDTAADGMLAEGVFAGFKQLMRARERIDESSAPRLRQSMLVLAAPSAAESAGYCSGVAEEMDKALAEGIHVAVVCLAGECEPSCFPADSDPQDDSYETYPYYEWDVIADELVRRAYQTRLRIRKFELFEVLNPAIEVDVDTIDAGGRYDDERHSIRWVLDAAEPWSQQTLSYRAKPKVVGQYSVRNDGVLIAYDTWGDLVTQRVSRLAIRVIEDPLVHANNIYLPWGFVRLEERRTHTLSVP